MEKQQPSGFIDEDPPTLVSPSVDSRNQNYEDTKDIVIKKAELQAAQYQKSYFLTAILLFSGFVIGYAYGLDANTRYVYTGYASASYGQHSLISTISVINAVIGAAAQIVYARLSDIFGRLYILIVAIVFYVVGTIIQSQAHDIERYCAGSVFYNLGYVGVLLIVLIIMSDLSTLRWRLLYQFIPAFPYVINTWISGNVTAAVGPLEHWSWGIGMWAFIFPLASLPFCCCLLHMRWLASRTPEWKEVVQRKTFFQRNGFVKTVIELFWRLDIIGVILLIAMLGCILVPLTLAGGTEETWSHGNIIAPLVVGIVLIPVFVFFEARFARYPLAPFKLLKDRGIWSALCLAFLLNFIYYMVANYLYTVLIVAVDESVTSATRISSLYSFVSTVWSPIFAIIVAYVRRLKYFIVFGVSLWFLSTGLLYHFRGGDGAGPGIIGGLCVWGIGGTMFSYPITVSMQSATSHENLAIVAAFSYTMYRIGSAVGNSVSGAVWTQLLPDRLARNLGNVTLAAEVYANPYKFAANYDWATPERQAAVEAYTHIQRLETVIALCFCTLLIVCSLFLRDPRLTNKVAHDGEIEEGQLIVKEDHDPVVEFVRTKIFRKEPRPKRVPCSSEIEEEDPIVEFIRTKIFKKAPRPRHTQEPALSADSIHDQGIDSNTEKKI